jgi:chromate transporter
VRRAANETASHGIPFAEATRVWWLVGLNSFGGPAGQIPLMHRMLVEERRWISEKRFLHGVNFTMLLPGPEAQQLATYIGWLLHGVRGGLVAGLLFILPGFVAILVLSIVYVQFGDAGIVEAIFYGIKPAVMAIVAFAVVRLGRRAIHGRIMAAIAVFGFVAIFFFDIPFPLVIAVAAAMGYVGGRLRPAAFTAAEDHGALLEGDDTPLLDDALSAGRPPLGRSLRVLAIGLAVWLVPLLVLAVAGGGRTIWTDLGAFFSFAAIVTFGGAYAVLAFVAQQAVQVYGWLMPGEMVDGLGMAETTPGPAIQVVQFVGFLGAYRLAGGVDPMLAGVAGAVLVTWVTFVPCFLWIFLGGPYAEYLRGRERLSAALSSITAAVVGVIANLGAWFALHTVFSEVGERRVGPVRLYVPEWSTVDLAAIGLAVAAFLALWRLRWPMLRVIAASAVVGATVHIAFVA